MKAISKMLKFYMHHVTVASGPQIPFHSDNPTVVASRSHYISIEYNAPDDLKADLLTSINDTGTSTHIDGNVPLRFAYCRYQSSECFG